MSGQNAGQGTQGVEGQGTQGAQGQAIQGTQGLSGQNAGQGTQGVTGQTTQGAQGVEGQGTQGRDGANAGQGAQGFTGTTTQGAQGQAIQGAQGPQGPQGIQGIQGTQGPQGIQGIQGTQGVQGPQGIQGINGQSIQGTTGTPTQGAQGVEGQGTQGVLGPQGRAGDIQGAQGVTGTATAVQGATGLSANQNLNTDSSVTFRDIYAIRNDGANAAGRTGVIYFGNQTSGNAYLYFDGTGYVLPTFKLSVGGDVIAYSGSDRRLKTNIEPITNALDKVNTLDGVTYNWNELATDKDQTIREAGLIAQQVAEVLPEVATTRDNGYMAIKYEKIIPLLVEAIKELSAEVKELKKKIS